MKTIKALLFILIIVGVSVFNVKAEEYVLNKKETSVKWKGKKIGGEHYGMVTLKSGVLEIDGKAVKGGKFVIDMNSMTNEDIEGEEWNKKLINHLKSPDFFEVEKYPEAVFVLKETERKSGDFYKMKGNLTIKDVTRPFAFVAEITKMNGQWHATGTMIIDRSDYNVKYGSKRFFKNLGDKLISDKFTLDFWIMMEKAE